MPTSEIVLYQFAFSHFNEKARWALDYKGLPSRRESLLPGLHARATGKAVAGAGQTPVLTIDGEGIAGSSDIVRALDERFPDPRLVPADAAEKESANAWVLWLDDVVGPAVRLALFHELFDDLDYAGKVFTTGHAGWKPALYRRMMPRLTPVLRKKMEINSETASAARTTIAEALERIAKAVDATGYLVGDRFTIADLTAASLCMPLYFPQKIPFAMPAQESPVLDAWLAKWAGHPAERYVRDMWDRHR